MKLFIRLVVVLLVLASSTYALAQTEAMLLETIKLEHKPAGDIIPLIEPFLPDNAVISGKGYKIILKTTAENMPQVKQLIADLDIPLQQLQISVSLNPAVLQQDTTQAAAPTEMSDQKTSEHPARAASDITRIYKIKGQEVTEGVQIVQVLPDRWSMIRTGRAIPVMKRIRNPDGTITESISYQQINQGLRIRPHFSGEEVILSIQPFYESASQSDTGQQLYYKPEKQTKTRLGTWISIDTTTGSHTQTEDNKLLQNRNPITTSLIYLKVDVAP